MAGAFYPLWMSALVVTAVWLIAQTPIDANDAKLGLYRDVTFLQEEHRVCGLRVDGTLWCWGGWLGRKDLWHSSVPLQVESPVKLKALVGYSDDPCAIGVDDGLYCDRKGTKALTREGSDRWRSVGGGSDDILGVMADGTLWLLSHHPLVGRLSVQRVGKSADWVEVLSTDGGPCARRKDRSLWCASDVAPQLLESHPEARKECIATLARDASPRAVEDGKCEEFLVALPARAEVVDVSVYAYSGIALVLADGALEGIGTSPREEIAAFLPAAPPVAGGWGSLSIGRGFAIGCGIAADGSLWCWGPELLNAPDAESLIKNPKAVPVGDGRDWRKIVVAAGPRCGIRGPGRLYCWGDNSDGRLGQGRSGELWGRKQPARVGIEPKADEHLEGVPPPPREVALPAGSTEELTQWLTDRLHACGSYFRPCDEKAPAATGHVQLGLDSEAEGPTSVEEVAYSTGLRADEVGSCLAAALDRCGLPPSAEGTVTFKLEQGVLDDGIGVAFGRKAKRRGDRLFDAPRVATIGEPSACPTTPQRQQGHFLPGPIAAVVGVPLPFGAAVEVCDTFTAEGRRVSAEVLDERAGVLLGRMTMLDGEPDGRWVLRQRDGQLLLDTTYRRGVPVGVEAAWDHTGGRTVSCEWRDGAPVGRCVRYRPAPPPGSPLDVGEEIVADGEWSPTGTPRGVHRREDPKGSTVEEISFAKRWQDVRGRIIHPKSGHILGVVAGTRSGFVRYRLRGPVLPAAATKAEWKSVDLLDARMRVTHAIVPCADHASLVGRIGASLMRWAQQWPKELRASPPRLDVRELIPLTGVYDARWEVTDAGRWVLHLDGKKGSHVEGDRWRFLGQPDDPNATDAYTTKRGEKRLPNPVRLAEACRDPVKHYKLPSHRPR